MKKNILVLIDNNDNGFFPEDTDYCIIKNLYNSSSLLARILRKIVFVLHLPLEFCFLNGWCNEDKNFETIILFETGNARFILRFLQKKFPKARLILWFWNSVENTIIPQKVRKSGVELWSFDPVDCKNYGLRHNTQFINLKNFAYKKTKKIVRDVFFVGTEKGRIKQLTCIRDLFQKKGISFDFHIVGDTNNVIPGLGGNYKEKINFNHVIDNDLSSKAILDIVCSGQHGLTLRPLEALFLKKKLITNFSLIKYYDFYNKNNIFILGEDDENNLVDFINGPFETSFNEKYYEMDSWIERFGKIKE